jgi:Enoyl-CoA hydratase/isomerase
MNLTREVRSHRRYTGLAAVTALIPPYIRRAASSVAGSVANRQRSSINSSVTSAGSYTMECSQSVSRCRVEILDELLKQLDSLARAGAEDVGADTADSDEPPHAHPWVLGTRFAKEILYTGDRFSAQRAYELGMVNRVVLREQLEKRRSRSRRALRQCRVAGSRSAKKAVNHCEDLTGLRHRMDAVFGLHHFAHAHNAE